LGKRVSPLPPCRLPSDNTSFEGGGRELNQVPTLPQRIFLL
jgi:hypothetical protein